MQKKSIIYIMFIVTIIISATILVYSSTNYKSEEEQLNTAFTNTGAKFVNWELYGWSKLDGKKVKSYEAIKSICQQMSTSFGMLKNGQLSIEEISTDNCKQIEINGEVTKGVIINIKGRVEVNSDTPQYSSISTDIMVDRFNENFSDIRDKVIKMFNENGLAPRINSCITGSFDGKLKSQLLNSIFVKAFNQIGAVKVDAVRDYNLISISAYCPNIKNYIRVKESRVNINLAIRYNSYENKTYIWLATPIITTEY